MSEQPSTSEDPPQPQASDEGGSSGSWWGWGSSWVASTVQNVSKASEKLGVYKLL